MKKYRVILMALLLSSSSIFAQTDQATTSAYTGESAKKVTISEAEAKKRAMDSLAIYDPETFSTLFDAVVVKGRDTRATQQGDSLIYNASAFKVLDGSSAEDLLSKMPGIVVEGGEVQAQGESVGKILVDGKEFFEGDINLAIKSLPADVIESVEVFDKESEQAAFTGFDDGEQIKTINFKTKEGYTKGTFGELYAGYGTDDRYKVGGNVNYFNEDRRISILGMSNNVNQQNFSQDDLSGVMSASSSGRRGSSGGSTKTLDGVTKSNAAGLNFVDAWGEKVKFTGSYFFNNSDNEQETSKLREYFESSLPGMTYEEYSESLMDNWNHRFNAKIDYNINDNNTLTITPNMSLQKNDKWSSVDGTNLSYGEQTENVITDTDTNTTAYNMGAEIVYRHRFTKAGRTLSLMLNGTLSNTDGETFTDYLTSVSGDTPVSSNQFQVSDNETVSLRSNLTYTEKLASKLQLSLSYQTAYNNSGIDKKVYTDQASYDLYEQLTPDETLSSVYNSDYLTQSGGMGLRYVNKSFSATLSANAQYATLMGDTTYPYEDKIDNKYFSILPSLFARYSIDDHNSFMLRYRSNSSSPSVSDLQDVIDNSNPLFMSTGNPDLDQQINHSASLRYIHTSIFGTSFIAMLGATVRQDYVADSTMVAMTDTQIGSVTLSEGAQLTKPVNLDGYYSLQAMLTYGFPIDFIYSNVNVSLSSNYSNVPTILNGVQSDTRELTLVPKIVIGSNISETVDFTLTYSSALNYAISTQEDSNSSDYQTHTATAKLGWEFWKGFTLRSELNYVNYVGLEMDDPNYYLLGASIGKKFLKKRSLEAKIEATDLLNQNRAFSRSVGSNYYDYINSNVLEGYVMATLVYTFR